MLLLGALAVKAGLANKDRAFLVGGFMQLAEMVPNSPDYDQLRDTGIKHFNESAKMPAQFKTR